MNHFKKVLLIFFSLSVFISLSSSAGLTTQQRAEIRQELDRKAMQEHQQAACKANFSRCWYSGLVKGSVSIFILACCFFYITKSTAFQVQRLRLFIVCGQLTLLIAVFPPWLAPAVKGGLYNKGHAFALTPPYMGSINHSILALEFIALAALAVMMYFFLKLKSAKTDS